MDKLKPKTYKVNNELMEIATVIGYGGMMDVLREELDYEETTGLAYEVNETIQAKNNRILSVFNVLNDKNILVNLEIVAGIIEESAKIRHKEISDKVNKAN